MAAELDEMVAGFRSRPLDAGPYLFVWIDALTHKVREGGRTVNVYARIATGVDADGHREILGLDVASSEDGAGWPAFLRGLAARSLAVVQLVTSTATTGRGTRSLPCRPARPGIHARRTTPGTRPPTWPSPPSRGCPPLSALSIKRRHSHTPPPDVATFGSRGVHI